MTIGKKIVGGLAVMLVLLFVLAVLSYRGIVRLLKTRDMVSHTYEVLTQLEELESKLKDAETGKRGYLITEDRSFYTPFLATPDVVRAALAEARRLTVDNPPQQYRLNALESVLEERFKDLNAILAAMNDGKFKEARDIVKNGHGRSLMEDIRRRVGELQQVERSLLETRKKEADETAALTQTTIVVASGLGGLFVVVAGTFLVRSVTHSIRQGVTQLTTTSAEILASINQQAAGAQEQAAAVAETVTTVNEVTQTSEQAAQRARSVGDMVQKTLEVGKSGRKVVEESQAAMTTVKGQVEQTARNILSLAEQAQSIGNIIAVVGDIAEQTNLLALNAAIEASRAGEQGKGFAVVATEVRALADQSRKATGQVRQILGEIQKATNTAVLSTEVVTRGVASAIEVADQAVGTIKTLAEGLTEASRASVQIAAAVGQQANGMTQIHHAMRNLDEVAKQNAVAARQSAQAADDLNKLGAQLSAMISK